MVEHLAERGDRAGAVARQLRRLRAQQFRQRLVAQALARFVGVPARRARVARADRDHAARKRRVALFSPARPGGERNQRGQAEDEADHAPGQRQQDRQRHDQAERDHQRNVVFDAAPGQRHLARVLGEPGQAVGRQASAARNSNRRIMASPLRAFQRAQEPLTRQS